MEIILVRHAQSEGNAKNLYSGITNDTLTDLGKKQAELLSRALAANLLKVDKVFCSPLVRSLETAKTVSKYLLLSEPEIDPRLAEINMGIWDGKPEEYIKNLDPQLFETWQSNPMETNIPQGENLIDVKSRIFEFCEEKASMGMERIVVVTHAGIIHSLLIPLLGREGDNFWSIKVENAGYSIVEWSKHPQVISINIVDHLTVIEEN